MKSVLNKTIDTSLEEGKPLLSRCLNIENVISGKLPNGLICGNSFEIMPLLSNGIADLIIADPPYNLTKSFNGRVFFKRNAQKYEEYTRRWLTEVLRLLKENGTIYVCCDWESSIVIGSVLSELAIVRNRITWQREKGRGAAANWKNSMEDIWFATKGEEFTFNLDAVKQRRRVIAPYRENGKPKDWVEEKDGNYRLTCPSNFWDDITVPFWSMSENTAHPTQKPEKLLAKLILASSKEGDTVFDPFVGSGSTLVTAKKLDRHYLGIEIDPQYCVWAQQRLEDAEDDRAIQGYYDGIFYERNYKVKK